MFIFIMDTCSVSSTYCMHSICSYITAVCSYQVGHLDVEEAVGVLVLVDVGQSSGIGLIFCQRADPAPFMVMKFCLRHRKIKKLLVATYLNPTHLFIQRSTPT